MKTFIIRNGSAWRKVLVALLLVFLACFSFHAFATGQGEKKAPAAAGPVTLVYTHWGDQNEIDATKALMDSYMKSHPNVTVKIEPIVYAEYMTKMTTMAASDTLPDLGFFLEPNVLQWGMEGQFLDLTDFYKTVQPKLDVLKFTTPDGKIVGVSVANEVYLIWYNPDIFDKAGLAYPPADAAHAWKWDEFVEVGKKLTLDANGRTPYDAGFDPNNIVRYGIRIPQWWMPQETLAMSNGGGYVSADGKRLILNSPASIEAIQKQADLINVQHVSPVPSPQNVAAQSTIETALLTGQVAMQADGQWTLLTLNITKRDSGLKFGIGVLPYMKELVTTSVGTPIVVFKTTKSPEEAKKLLEFVMDPQNSLPLIQNGLWMPNEVRWYTDPTLMAQWIDNPSHPPEYKTAVVDFALKYSRQQALYRVPTFARMNDVITPALEQVWLGKKSAADVINNEIMPRITPIFEGK